MVEAVMRREIRNPIWKTEEKESVMCQIAIIDDAGNETVHRGEVSKWGEGDNTNPDWLGIFEKYSVDDIDKNTEEFDSNQQEEAEKNREIREEEKKRREERKKQEDLFAIKLEIFEIPEIKESEDRPAKANIRKAKSTTEAIVYAAKIMMENNSGDTPAAE
jgi:hypothetical protein